MGEQIENAEKKTKEMEQTIISLKEINSQKKIDLDQFQEREDEYQKVHEDAEKRKVDLEEELKKFKQNYEDVFTEQKSMFELTESQKA